MTDDEIAGACRPSRRLTAFSLVTWAVLAFALPLSALTLNVVKIAGFPLGFWMAAQGVLILLALLAGVFAARAGGRHGPDRWGEALQYAGESIMSAGFIGIVGLIAGLGYDGLAFPIGIAAGLALTTILISPRFVLYPVRSFAGFLHLRFGTAGPARAALAIATLSLMLILAADLKGAALAVQGLTGASFGLALAGAAGAFVLFWLARPMIPDTMPKGTTYGLLLVAFVATLVVLALKDGRLPIPQLVYGLALEDLRALETRLIETKLADIKSLRPLAQPFLQLSMWNFAGLVAGVGLGLAVLPHLLSRHLAQGTVTAGDAPRRTARALAMVVLFLIGLAAFTVLARAVIEGLLLAGLKTGALPDAFARASGLGWIEICGLQSGSGAEIAAACAKLSGQKGLLRLQDLGFLNDGFLFAASALAGVPQPAFLALLAGGLLAALVSGQAILQGITTAETELRGRAANPNRSLDARTTALALLVLAGASSMALLDPRDIVSLASEGAAVIAASLFPAIVLGLYWRRMSAAGAFAALIVGTAVCGGYIVAVRFFPVTFFDWTAQWSNAAPQAVQKFARLKAEVAAATDETARATLKAALWKQAQVVANLWGLKPGAAALLGIPAAFLAAVAASFAGRSGRGEA